MLSEEEKKAIEKLKKIKEDTIKANECGLSNNDFKEEIEVYDTVLNLITKLQKENEILKRAFDKQTADMSNNLLELQQKDKYIKDSEDITKEMGNDINGLLLEIKEKDKQIDLMARAFKQDDVRSVEEIKQYFERKVEDENR